MQRAIDKFVINSVKWEIGIDREEGEVVVKLSSIPILINLECVDIPVKIEVAKDVFFAGGLGHVD